MECTVNVQECKSRQLLFLSFYIKDDRQPNLMLCNIEFFFE